MIQIIRYTNSTIPNTTTKTGFIINEAVGNPNVFLAGNMFKFTGAVDIYNIRFKCTSLTSFPGGTVQIAVLSHQDTQPVDPNNALVVGGTTNTILLGSYMFSDSSGSLQFINPANPSGAVTLRQVSTGLIYKVYKNQDLLTDFISIALDLSSAVGPNFDATFSVEIDWLPGLGGGTLITV